MPRSASEIFASLDLRSAEAVVDVLERGAAANRSAGCRQGSTDVVMIEEDQRGTPGATLVASGDLHDNPLHLMRLCRAAGLEPQEGATDAGVDERRVRHVTLHELIHGERLVNGMDFSYRVLARVAALKAAFPFHVHTLLANHELAQAHGQLVAKDGVRCNEAFDEALELTFGGEASAVAGAVRAFVMSMALALKFAGPGGAVLCAHSLPSPELMDRFDPGVLERELMDEDCVSRRGSAHLMVWGRGHTSEQINRLSERWGVRAFVLGHEKAEKGATVLNERAVVLNSDHEAGAYVVLDACESWDAQHVAAGRVRLGDG